tara:strand:- start:2532 stop:3035 length:504 start_codon:yes stop_codon:yes gene_type:complete
MNKRKIALLGPAFRDEFLQPFDNLFDQFVGDMYPEFHKEFGVEFFGKGAYPRVDIIDRDTGVDIVAEIPGLTRDDVTIDIDPDKSNPNNNVLSISGSSRVYNNDGTTEVEPRYVRRELKRSSFKRSFILGENLNVDKIDAKFENGVLEICVPKIKPINTKSRKVEIK